ncbi:MAG: aminoacyl-tRNA hydrolase [Planctomycetota bacterium]
MKLVVGLGNPGKQYAGTRHNIGFEVLYELTRRFIAPLSRQKFEAEYAELQLQQEKVLLVAPLTYMNLSGQSVQKFCSFYHLAPTDVLVVCDDLNLPLGKLRMRASGSAGGQKGLQNITQLLGTQEVARLRIGIDPPPAGRDAKDWVLGAFSKSELPIVETAVQQAAQAVETWVTQGLAAAMNRFNPEPDAPKPTKKERKVSNPNVPEKKLDEPQLPER